MSDGQRQELTTSTLSCQARVEAEDCKPLCHGFPLGEFHSGAATDLSVAIVTLLLLLQRGNDPFFETVDIKSLA
jgi:hypothetical protein